MQFPWWVEPANESTRTLKDAWVRFAVLSNELGTPKVLHCPSGTGKQTASDFSGNPASGFAGLGYNALSDWFGCEAGDYVPGHELADDRNAVGRDNLTCGVVGLTNAITALNACSPRKSPLPTPSSRTTGNHCGTSPP